MSFTTCWVLEGQVWKLTAKLNICEDTQCCRPSDSCLTKQKEAAPTSVASPEGFELALYIFQCWHSQHTAQNMQKSDLKSNTNITFLVRDHLNVLQVHPLSFSPELNMRRVWSAHQWSVFDGNCCHLEEMNSWPQHWLGVCFMSVQTMAVQEEQTQPWAGGGKGSSEFPSKHLWRF